MRRVLPALALLTGFLPALAAAQVPNFPQTLPANTIVGRLGIGPGPAQAIPFLQLGLVRTASPIIGLTGTQSGSIGLQGLTSGTVTLTVAPVAGTWTATLPTTPGTAGQFITTDGTGVLSWTAGTGTINTGTIGQLPKYTGATALSPEPNLSVSGGTLTIGQAGVQLGGLAIAGGTSGSTLVTVASAASGTLTLPSATDTLVGRATTDTLTNKTLTSPTLTTPSLGVATATSINKVAITAPATSATLAIGDGKQLAANNTLTFAGTDSTVITFQGTDTYVGRATTDTFTNKTFDTAGTGNSFKIGGVSVTGVTGTGAAVLANTPTLITPVLGIATATTINKVALTAPATGSTLTIADGKTLTASNTLTLTGTDATSFIFPTTSDTVIGAAASQTLTNKTLTAPTINGGTATALTALGIRSTGTGAFDLTLNNTENLTAGRTLTLKINNASRTFDVSGNLTLASDFITAGANSLTLTTSGMTNVTLPTTGTLVNTAVTSLASLATVGTITTGTWTGTAIAVANGGTGQTTAPLARGSTGLNIDALRSIGDTNATLTSTDRTAATSATFTASRTWTLPAASTLNAGQRLVVVDLFGGVNATNTLIISRAGADTINGGASVTINTSNGSYELWSDGVSKWSAQALGSQSTAGVSSVGGLTGAIGLGTGIEASGSNIQLTAARQTLPTRQVFTTGTALTYTKPANVLWIRIRAVGGGGGGGGGGTGAPGNGTGGTATTFSGGSLSAGGGAGGQNNNTGAAGGGASGGNILNANGGSGFTGFVFATGYIGGNGGNSTLLAGGGAGGGITPSAGAAGGVNTGGGGGGGGTSTTQPGAGAGAGAVVEHVITSPAATYTYTIGPGGNGGAAGTNGGAGGNGGSGYIVVEEFYGS